MSRLVSVVIPVYDEKESLEALHAELRAVLPRLGCESEIIFVDDGSVDGSAAVLDSLAAGDPGTKVVHLRRNFGQTAALSAGFRHASGDLIVAMDGDGQDDPAEIPRLLDTMVREEADIVSGWRRHRRDAWLTRTLPSRAANTLISWITGVHLHDYGCTLKLYRADLIKNVGLYGEMHRFLPALASWHGAKVTELEVAHRPRLRGRSKYGLFRVFKVILDLITVKFMNHFTTKPIYLFGGLGFLSVFASFAALAALIWLKLATGVSMIQSPLLHLSALLFTLGVQLVMLGLVAEMLVRTYFESQGKSTYTVARLVNFDRAAERRNG